MFLRFRALASLYVLAVSLSLQAGAAQYHVDSRRGDDGADGTRLKAQDGSGPWRSLARAAASIKPGDGLVLACGSVWNERLVLRGGNPGRPVMVTVPATGCAASERPVIQPREPIRFISKEKSWLAVGAVEDVARVFIDGAEIPPTFFGGKPWLKLDATQSWSMQKAGTSKVVAPALVQRLGPALEGATIALRTTPYRVERRRVRKVEEGAELLLDKPTHYPVSGATQYYVTHVANPGFRGWARAEGGIALYGIRSVEDSYVVRALPAVEAFGSVSLSGFDVNDAGAEGVLVRNGPKSELRDIRVSRAALDGVALRESPGALVDNLMIASSGRDGLRLEQSDDTVVTRNSIIDTAMTGPPVDSFAVINAETSNRVSIEGNRIKGAAYLGIRFKRQSKVIGNLVEETCARFPDCGAIYAWARLDPDPLFASEVRANVIRSVVLRESSAGDAPSIAAGVYLDDLSSGIALEGNVITGAAQGVFMHNSTANLIKGNTFFRSEDCEICMVAGISRQVSERMGSTRILGNAIYPSQGGVPYRLYSRFGSPEWKRFEGNLINREKDRALALISLDRPGAGNGVRLGAAEWNQRIATPDTLLVGELREPLTAAKGSEIARGVQTLTNGWLAWSETRSATLNQSRCDDPSCVGFSLQKKELGRLVSGYLSPSPAARISLSFSACAEKEATASLRIEVRGGQVPYPLLADLGAIRLDSEWEPFSLEGRLRNIGKDEARLHFVSDGPTRFSLKKVEVLRGGESRKPQPILLLNDGTTLQSFNCSDTGIGCEYTWFIQDEPVIWPLVLSPMSAKVLTPGFRGAMDAR